MIFFLFILCFSYIRGDCLEFTNNQTNNRCLIKYSENYSATAYHYSECLRCEIQTLLQPEDIKIKEDDQCLQINLQCIQLEFLNNEIFEEFFQVHQHFIYDLFDKHNGITQNTLHIIIQRNTLEEMNDKYVEEIFELKYQAYRVVFFELYIQNQAILINEDLSNISRLSLKIILTCMNDTNRVQTIYVVHEHKIILEGDQDQCPSTIVSSTIHVTLEEDTTLPSTEPSRLVQHESLHTFRITVLLTICLLILLIALITCHLRYRRHKTSQLSKTTDSNSDLSISDGTRMETPSPVNDESNLHVQVNTPSRSTRAMQWLQDDI